MKNNEGLARYAGVFRARKKPIVVDVSFADQAGVLYTREGPVRHRAGDAILTGVEGECWPVVRDRFDATYEPTDTVEAGTPGQYIKRALAVWAWRVDQMLTVELSDHRGTLIAQSGDVVIEYEPGDLGIVSSEIFARTYETAD